MTKKERVVWIAVAVLLGVLAMAGVWLPLTQSAPEVGQVQTVTNRFTNIIISTTTGASLIITQTGVAPIIVNGITFTYTAPLTITGVLTDVRFLYYQAP